MNVNGARAFWVTTPGRGEILETPLAPSQQDDVVVRTLYSGISRGTEALVFLGRIPPSEYQRMRAPFQEGDFPAPVKYGYANVGIVEEGVDALKGRTVFALYPHQTRYRVSASAVHPLPAGVPPERAILAANLETAITGVWDAAAGVGDRVVVIGAGTVGCLTAWLIGQIPGTDVTLVDVNAERAAVAQTLGVRFAQPDEARGEADVVIHASASPDGLRRAMSLAGTHATIVEMSWYGDQMVLLPLGEAFHVHRLTLTSSQVGQIPPARRPRWSSTRRLELALRMLADPAVDVLITGESVFDALPGVMARLATTPGNTICHRVVY